MFFSVCFELKGIHFGFPTYICSLAQMRQRHLPEVFQKGYHPRGSTVLSQGIHCTPFSRDYRKLLYQSMLSRAVSQSSCFYYGIPPHQLHLFSPRGIKLRALILINPSPLTFYLPNCFL